MASHECGTAEGLEVHTLSTQMSCMGPVIFETMQGKLGRSWISQLKYLDAVISQSSSSWL